MPPDDVAHAAPARRPSRQDPLWLWIAAGVLLVARVGLGVYEHRKPPERADLVSWVPAEAATARAATERKPILYDFSAEWCGPCRQMRDEVFADERLASAVSRLAVPVRVVDRQQEDGRNPALVDSLQRVHEVNAFPTLVVVGADGKALDRMEGFHGKQEFMSWLTKASVKEKLSEQESGGVKLP